MKIETKVVIDGRPCTKVFQKNDITVYSVDRELPDEEILFFVKGDKVLFSQQIIADCDQNIGYIRRIDYQGFN